MRNERVRHKGCRTDGLEILQQMLVGGQAQGAHGEVSARARQIRHDQTGMGLLGYCACAATTAISDSAAVASALTVQGMFAKYLIKSHTYEHPSGLGAG